MKTATKEWKLMKKSRSWPKPRHAHTASLNSVDSKVAVTFLFWQTRVEKPMKACSSSEELQRMVKLWMTCGSTLSQNSYGGSWTLQVMFHFQGMWNRCNDWFLRWGHSAVVFENKLWIFGGFAKSSNDELYCLDLGSNVCFVLTWKSHWNGEKWMQKDHPL